MSLDVFYHCKNQHVALCIKYAHNLCMIRHFQVYVQLSGVLSLNDSHKTGLTKTIIKKSVTLNKINVN